MRPNALSPEPGARWPIPRLPVFGPHAWRGAAAADTPCVLDLPCCEFSTSGRASIALALQLLGVRPKEHVLLPSYHCPTMVAPAAALGALPHFYPLDDHGAPRIDWLSTHFPSSARVMLVAHFFGLPQPMAEIRRWCNSRGIALIEDCAHALFGRSDGQPIGSWGDVAIVSLTKFLPVPEGGCLILNRDQRPPALQPCGVRQQIKAVLDVVEEGGRHGRLGPLSRPFTATLDALRTLSPGRDRPATARPGTADGPEPSSDFDLDIALASRQLSWASRALARLLPRQRIVEQRRRVHAQFVRELGRLSGLRLLLPELRDGAAPYVLPIWVQRPDPGYQALRAEGVPVFRWDRLWPDVPDLPADVGKDWSHHVIQLACHQDLNAGDVDRIVAAVGRHLASRD